MRVPAVVARNPEGNVWRSVSIVLALVAAAIYFWTARESFSHGGSPVGLAYGIAGFALIVLLAVFGIRKRAYRSRLGTVSHWLQSHIYLGLLAITVLLLHTGGRFHDKLAVAAFVLAAIVVGSGIAGAVLYATIPRLLTEVESDVPPQEIDELGRTMAEMASRRSPPFRDLFDAVMNERIDLEPLIAAVPREEQRDAREMLVTARQRRELLLRLRLQQRYRKILDAWLYVHVPFTFALLVLAAAHVVAVFYFGAVRW